MNTRERKIIKYTSSVNGEDKLAAYLRVRALGTSCLVASRNGGGTVISDRYVIHRFQDELTRLEASNSKVSKAVMASMLASEQHWMYPDRTVPRFNLTNIFPNWSQNEVEEINKIIGRIRINTRHGYSRFDWSRFKEDQLVKEHGIEETRFLIFEGLNGCGKTTVINAVGEFLTDLGLDYGKIKFPRPDSSIGQLINSALNHETSIEPRALQMLFLADFMDWLKTPDKPSIILLDRSAITSGQMFSPDFTKFISLLVGAETADVQVSMIGIDRIPAGCKRSVDARERQARIFEKKIEQMAAQQIELWRVANSPRSVLINTDFPVGNDEEIQKAIYWTKYRVLATLASNKLIEAALIKTGKAKNNMEARLIVESKLSEWAKNNAITDPNAFEDVREKG